MHFFHCSGSSTVAIDNKIEQAMVSINVYLKSSSCKVTEKPFLLIDLWLNKTIVNFIAQFLQHQLLLDVIVTMDITSHHQVK